jgi:hypothetical protein
LKYTILTSNNFSINDFHFKIIGLNAPFQFTSPHHFIRSRQPFKRFQLYVCISLLFQTIICFIKVVQPLRLVVSFFPGSFPLIFHSNLTPSTLRFHTLLIGSSLMNTSHNIHFNNFPLIRSHLSFTWLFNFQIIHPFFRSNDKTLLIAICSIGSFFFSGIVAVIPLVNSIQNHRSFSHLFLLVSSTSLSICFPSLVKSNNR